MSDIDAIRKKHEEQMNYTKTKQGDFPYLFQSIHSNLSISDVDALFAALDEARGKVEKASNLVSEAMKIYTYLADDHPHFVYVFDELNEILKGAGDER